MDPTGSISDVDLESELERVHTELRIFLQKKRSKKATGGGGGTGGAVGGSGASGEDQVLFIAAAGRNRGRVEISK